jgi:Ca2+-binding RTX toxin-like protein
MEGGLGNDVYHTDGNDNIIESWEDPGIDTVVSSVSYGILFYAAMENITLAPGSAASVAQGNSTDNALTGNEGDNELIGMEGSDTLTGGGGSDRFVFVAAFAPDTVMDFTAGDILALGTGLFDLPLGALDPDAFHSGPGATEAQTASHRILYDTTSGDLYYDANGSDAGDPVHFATLFGAPALSASDFDIF